MHPTLRAALAKLQRARRELEETVRMATTPPMTYEEWKAQRLERSPDRCDGHPTFIRSRVQPCDVYRLSHHDMNYASTLAAWRVSAEDVEYSKRFCAEEPHWEILRNGYDHSQKRKLTDEEYEALRTEWKLDSPPRRKHKHRRK